MEQVKKYNMKLVYKAFEQLPVLGTGQFTLKEVIFRFKDDECDLPMMNNFNSPQIAEINIKGFYGRKGKGKVTFTPENPDNLVIMSVIQK